MIACCRKCQKFNKFSFTIALHCSDFQQTFLCQFSQVLFFTIWSNFTAFNLHNKHWVRYTRQRSLFYKIKIYFKNNPSIISDWRAAETRNVGRKVTNYHEVEVQALAGPLEPSQQNLLDNEEKQKPGGQKKTTNQSNDGEERRGEHSH